MNSNEQYLYWQSLHEKYGWNLIPLNGKRPIEKDWNKYSQEKRELNPNEFVGKNAGIVCGLASNLLVLDVDNPILFEAVVKSLNLQVPETFKVKTAKGYHLYFEYPHNVEAKCRACKHPFISKFSVFDVRGFGGQVVAPMSIHPDTGEPYMLEIDCAPASPPEWLVEYSTRGIIELSFLCNHPHNTDALDLYVTNLRKKFDSSTVDDIINSKEVGERSECIARVLTKLISNGFVEEEIFFIFNHFAIGDKYREKMDNKENWLRGEISRCNSFVANRKLSNTRLRQS